ncbi:MAG: hypothetical protein E6G07_03155 [Actinobacteria bacterium]|nr:MAG: hypothetical protein E6G07_03155 [Actinomycetota bacterium]
MDPPHRDIRHLEEVVGQPVEELSRRTGETTIVMPANRCSKLALVDRRAVSVEHRHQEISMLRSQCPK